MQAGGQEDRAFRRTGEVEIDLFEWENRLIELNTLSKVTQTSGKTDMGQAAMILDFWWTMYFTVYIN